MKTLVLVLAMCFAATADARPGGGHSFSSGGGGGGHSYSGGGGYHSSGGGGGSLGGGELALMVLLLVIVIVVKIAAARPTPSWNSSAPTPTPPAADLGPLLESDPDFSRAVFEDFAYELYAAAHRDPSQLAAYLSPGAVEQLTTRAQQVVVGAVRLEAVDVSQLPPRQRLGLRIEANLVLGGTTIATVEHWVFTRALGVRTKPPVKTHTWPCPNCGAPWSPADGNPRVCGHCRQDIEVGRFDWAVDYISVESQTDVGPTLTGTVAEAGNDLPTVVDPAADATLATLQAGDPAVTMDALVARATMIYGRLNEAWNTSNLGPVRGLVTRSLLDYLHFWLDEYRRQHLANHLDNAVVQRMELSKVQRDHYFDAVTIRVYADGNDYTLDGDDKVVGGSRTTRRAYTEYWTFLRSSTRRGPTVTTPTCPNCGAPLAISDGGTCTHCNAEVENGSFDWVLSKIEQDDVYTG